MSGNNQGHVFEVLCELRFSGSPSFPASVILPGFLFTRLKKENLVSKFEPLPQSGIPTQMREADDNLKYLTTHRMVGEKGFIAAVGDHALSVSITQDYNGWPDLRDKASKVFAHAITSEALGTIERVSIKYLNLFPSDLGQDQFRLIDGSVRLGSRTLTSESTQLRYEFQLGEVTASVNIVSQATLQAQVGSFRATGLVLDMDFIVSRPHMNLEDVLSSLDEAHRRANETYTDIVGKK